MMHRRELITTETFHLVGVLSLSLATLALLLGLAAFAELWFSGDKGWGKAFAGIVLGAFCLSPAIFAATEWQRYPNIYDVSKSPELSLQLQEASASSKTDLEAEQAATRIAFPNVLTRDYQIRAQPLYELVENLVAQRQWKAIEKTSFAGGIGNVAEIRVNATTLLGWRDQVVIRVTSQDGQGAKLDMRSAARIPGHDFGRNGKRIEEFLTALDAAVTQYARDNLTIEPSSGN